MSPPTYIGPFGRILPVPEGSEPEQLPRLLDGDRTDLHLPQPALNFGSDTSLGVTDPRGYNTTGQARRPRDIRQSHGEQPRTSGTGTLPSVRQLLTPATQSSLPTSPFSSQHSAASSQRRSSLASSHQSPGHELSPDHSHTFQQNPGGNVEATMQAVPSAGNAGNPQAPPHVPQNAQQYSSSQHFASEYGSYGQMPPQIPYQPQSTFGPPLHHPPLVIPQQYTYDSALGSVPHIPHGYYQEYPNEYMYNPNVGDQPTANLQSPNNQVKPAPRLVREDVVPGEGAVWVYEDGTTCPKIVDGEPVNAEWGVTKAGKPRKRLAIACTSCREKKIKCDPAEPRCVQCEKFGRDCKFATA